MLISSLEFDKLKETVVSRRPIAAPKVGDDSIGWKQCRAVEQSTKRLERTRLMRQVVHSQGSKRKAGTPPAHLRSIDFTGLVPYGRPTKAAQEHFKHLIQVKKGVWSEGR